MVRQGRFRRERRKHPFWPESDKSRGLGRSPNQTEIFFLSFGPGDQALRFAIPAMSCRLARCIAMAASVSDCSWANRSSSAMVIPGRR